MSFLDSVGRDLRYALRGLSRRPGFTLAAVLTLALGIGATTAIFSVVYSVLIKSLPYPNADELVRIRHTAPGLGAPDMVASTNMHLTYRQENRAFAAIGLWMEDSATLTVRGEAERVRALRVTDGTLQALGIRPLRGRWFTDQEHELAADGPTPVIITHAFWQRRFGADESALGRELSMDSPGGAGTVPLPPSSKIVGIMPPEFQFVPAAGAQPDIIIPVRMDPARQAHGIYSWQMLARLKPGVTLTEAQADLDRIRPIWADAWPLFPGMTKEQFDNWRLVAVVHPLLDDLVGGVSSMLWVLMGAIGAVLMIACANIANLMLVRADARGPEFAVRAALGARPTQIGRELLVESLVLGAAGSVVGLMLAYAGLRALVAIGPSNLPRLQEIAVYPPVLTFTVAISLASALVFGSITALKQALQRNAPFTGAARGSSASRERSATRNTLVVVQVALAVVLVVSAALMIRTVQALRDVDPGLADPATIQTARIWIPAGVSRDQEQITRIEHEMLDKIAALPGVTRAGFASHVPMDSGNNGPVTVEGQPAAAGETLPSRRWIRVSPGYFAAVGTRMIAGRDLTWSDIETGGRVAVISEDFARELAAEPAGALGLRIRPGPFPQDDWKEVIGVVQNVQQDGLQATAPSSVYWPTLSSNTLGAPVAGTTSVAFAVRSERAGASSLVEEIRDAVRAVSATVPVAQERTVQDLFAGSVARTSFTLVLLGIAGAMALALSVIGIYGVIAYVVSQRTREIGIRSALGARPGQLEQMFLRQGLALTGVGLVVGVVAAIALGRWMSSLLFGVGPFDAVAYVAALSVTTVAAALASYMPARRAAMIDPIETIRAE